MYHLMYLLVKFLCCAIDSFVIYDLEFPPQPRCLSDGWSRFVRLMNVSILTDLLINTHIPSIVDLCKQSDLMA